jgi:hypothetical protein
MFTKLSPLPGESFWSQVPTHWLRDPRLRGVDKAVLGYLQTHEVGYRVTMEQLIAEMYEGKDALYASVGRLVDLAYLVRAQPRTEQGKFEAVDYTFGPAAFEATYVRNWGRRPAPADVPAGQTGSGFSGTGQPGTGQPGTGKGATKKIRVKRSGLVPPPTPAPVPPAGSVPEQRTGGGIDLSKNNQPPAPPASLAEQQTRMAALVEEVHAARHWPKASIRRVVADIVGEGAHPWPVIAAVMRRVAADPASQGAARLLHVPESWWAEPTGTPPAAAPRRRPWCGQCAPASRLTDTEPARPCPQCSPLVVGMADATVAG